MRKNHESEMEEIKQRHVTETQQNHETINQLQLMRTDTPDRVLYHTILYRPVPKLTLTKVAGLFHLKVNFKTDLERNFTQSGVSSNGTEWFILRSNYVDIEAGQLAVCLEKHVETPLNPFIRDVVATKEYIVHLHLKKSKTVEKVEADWTTTISWKHMFTTSTVDVIGSTSTLSHCFAKDTEQGGSKIKHFPKSVTELSIHINVTSWDMKWMEQRESPTAPSFYNFNDVNFDVAFD